MKAPRGDRPKARTPPVPDRHAAASRLAAIVASSDDAIIGKDLNGIVTSWNHGAEQIFGYAADEMVGRSILEIVPADRQDEEGSILERLRAGESVTRLETVRVTKDGRRLDVSVTASPIRDARGRIIGASKIARDITHSKRAQAALREREEQLRLYAEHSPLAVAMLDDRMRYLVASRRWREDYRLQDEPLAGRSHYDVFPDIPERWKAIHRRCLQGAIEKCDEDRFPRADGRTDWIRWEIRPWRRADGSIGGIIIFSEDISQRKAAVEALRASEERTRFALENANIGLWDMDYTTGVLQWSEVLERQYGLAPGAFGGTFEAFIERVHPEDRAGLMSTIEHAMKSGADFSTEHRSLWPDGTVRRLHSIGRVVLGEGGRPVRAVGIGMDVTARHTLEAQFQQAQKMEAVGRLAGGIAHDFNNLLTAILGYCELAVDQLGANDTLRQDITEIQKAGLTASRLTRQLLAFSRKEIIEPALLDVNDVINGMRDMVGRMIGEDVRIVLQLHPAPVRAVADRGQMEQLVMNLIVNARDAMPRGGTLTIETDVIELDDTYAARHFNVKPGAYSALTISDTGVGMSREVQEHLFEPFFTTKEAGKGTGLGLATVHGVVTRAGGSISVYSEPGRGTSFTVYFPYTAALDAPPAPPPPAKSSVAGRTVLVVEDEEGLRVLTRRLLEHLGCIVLTAASADEARPLVSAHPEIDVLLTDVVMPGVSGSELSVEIVGRRPAIKVIYMSGYTQDMIVQHGVLKPGIAFLHKPFTREMLARKLRDVLER